MGFLTSTNTSPTPGGMLMSGINSLGSLSDMTGLPTWLQSKVGNPVKGTTPMYPPSGSGMDQAAMQAAAERSAAEQLARKRKAQ